MGRKRNQSSESGGGGAFIGVLFIVGLIVKFIWWILGALALVAAFFVVRALIRYLRAEIAERNRSRAEIASRADQQHAWVLSGDDRGTYGIEGAELMHYISPERTPSRFG